MFHEAARKTYDAALCMYHDQALIPIKTLAFDHAVNVTLGLPFVRTSPDHGTAFDIAGTGKADPVEPDRRAAACGAAAARAPHAPTTRLNEPIDDLPPLREVIRRHGLSRQEVARPELPARSQPDGADRPRRRSARRRHRGRDRPRPGRADARAAGARRARVIAVERDERAIAALAEIAARYPGRLDDRLRRCAGIRSSAATWRRPDAHRRQSALQHRHRTAGVMAYGRAVAAVVRRLVLMFQREVAERIVAAPGSKAYGRLSVLARLALRSRDPVRHRRRQPSCRRRR